MKSIKKEKKQDTYYVNEPGIIFKTTLRGVIKVGFRLILNVRSKRNPDIEQLEGATILLGNHVSAIDPFLMGAYVTKKWVHYITSSSYFEYPSLKKLLEYVGAIPKRQGVPDIRSTRMAISVLKNNGTVGLFPEGGRTIDGSMLPFNTSAAKLIKQTNSNVVISHINGASISLPRWYRGVSGGYRRGRIEHKAYMLFTKEQISNLNVSQIDEKIREALYYNEYDWQRENKVKFHSNSMAEGMHSILHKCPSCLHDYSMDSKKDKLFCTNCGNTAIVDKYGLINPQSEKDVVYPDMVIWRKWQNSILCKEIADKDFSMHFEGSLDVKDSFGKIIEVHPNCQLDINVKEIVYTYPKGVINLSFYSITDAVCDYSLRFEINQEHNSYQFTPTNGQVVVKIIYTIKCIKGIL